MPHNKLQRCRVTQGIFTQYLFSEEFVLCFVDTRFSYILKTACLMKDEINDSLTRKLRML